MASKRRLTLADVAKAAGVSKMTASRALREASDVSSENIDLVQQKAKEIGYVGNNLAASMAGQQSSLIGVIIPSLANTVFTEVLAGITEGIEGSGLQAAIGVTDYDEEKEYQTIKNMLSWSPSGLIIAGLDQPDFTRKLLETAQIPIVQIMDLDGEAVDSCVGISHLAAGEAMADALIKRNCKNFAYAGFDLSKDSRSNKRFTGFRDQLLKNNLDFIATHISSEHSSTETGRLATAKLLMENPSIDCIYYSNDDLAAGGALHCIANNIRVPDQVSLAGFNGLDLIKSLPIKVATSHTPRRNIGKSAAKIIINRHKNDEATKQLVEFMPSLEL